MNRIISNDKENSEIKEDKEDITFRDLTEVDIFSKKYGFDEEFIDRMLSQNCKWKEKKDAFDQLAKCTDQSRIKSIKNTDRSYFIEMVKKLLKQPNINVVHSIINALNNLSLGLNSNFSEAKDLFPYLLNYLKEKKESIINSLIICLCNFSLFINDNIINEKLMNYFSVKQLCNIAKINLCSFIEKLIEKKNNIQLNCYISLIIKITKLLDDPNPEVREKSAKLMGYINFKKKEIFTSISNSIKIDERKQNKIEEYEKLYINYSSNNTNTKNIVLNNQKNSEKKDNSNLKQKKFGKKLLDNDNSKNNKIKNNNLIQINENEKVNNSKKELSNNITDENCLELIKENLIDNKEEIIFYVQKNIQNLNNYLFNSLKWEERKEGFSFLNNYFLDENNLEDINNSYDYYFKYILINNRFFNEKNSFVLNESILCINTFIEKINDFSKKYFKVIISLLTNKLNEKKIVGQIYIIIKNLLYKVSPYEVISIFIMNLKNKSIIILKEGTDIIKNIIGISKCLEDFPLSDIISFCIELENNPNNMLRKGATQLLCSIYKIIGKEIYNYLKNIKESTMTVINNEFNKIGKEDNIIEENNKERINCQNEESIDISNKITEEMIKELNSGKWYQKKKVIEQIEEIISQGKHNILSNGLNELFYAIKSNLNDGNKNIVKFCIILVSEFISALSPGLNLKSFVNLVISDIISNFSESKNSIKEEAVKCVNKINNILGFEYIINYFTNHLKTENYDLRNEILKIILKNKNCISNQKEYKELIKPLINCLLDKNANIRNMSKLIIQEIMKFFPIDTITNYINKLKPSYIEKINNIIFSDKSPNNTKVKKTDISDSNTSKIITKNKLNFIASSKQSDNTSQSFLNYSPFNMDKTQAKINENNSQNNLKTQLSNNKKIYDKTNISKSPLLTTKTKSKNSNYNYNIVDVLPPEQNELPNYIKSLYENDLSNKILSLTEIKKILIHSIEKNRINVEQIKEILIAFNNLLAIINNNIKTKKSNIDKNEIILLRYLLDDYIYIANIKSLINNIEDSDIIYNSYEKLFLLISKKEFQSINCGPEILSIINKIILCLLTNFNKTLTISILIKIISDYKSNINEVKICSLSIKCLDKFRKILSQIQNNIDNNLIFVTLYNFFKDFIITNENLEPHSENERNALLMINSIISEYINIYSNSIWDIYSESLDSNMLKLDIYFKRTIEVLIKSINSKKIFNSKKTNKSLEYNSEINNEFKEDILNYINDLKTKGNKITPEEKYNYYYEIVNLLRINNINISFLSNKIDGDIFAKICEIYYGINTNSNNQSKDFSTISNIQSKFQTSLNEQKNKNKDQSSFKKLNHSKTGNKFKNNLIKNDINSPKKEKEISEQSKRILEYKNKFKYLTESNKNRKQNSLEKNDENKQLNNENKNSNNFISNEINQMDEIDKIGLKNKNENENKKIIYKNNNDQINNMRRMLEEIRKKIN